MQLSNRLTGPAIADNENMSVCLVTIIQLECQNHLQECRSFIIELDGTGDLEDSRLSPLSKPGILVTGQCTKANALLAAVAGQLQLQ